MAKQWTEGMSPAEQRALLERLLRSRADRESAFPLSRGQHALWILHRMAPESAAYNIVFAATVRSPVQIPVLRRALKAVTQRHEMLRTTFEVRNELPVYRVHPAAVEPLLEEVDAGSWEQVEIERRLVEAGREPFDLEKGPLFRARAFRRAGGETVLLLTMHHIVFDGWSHEVLLRDLQAAYEGESRGTPAALPPQAHRYADYVAWQEELLGGPQGEAMWAYWQRRLSPPLPLIELPTDLPRPQSQSFRGGTHSFHIDASLGGQLDDLARSHGVTLYMVLLAAFQTLLGRYSGQDDVLIGSPMAGRDQSRFDALVGYFVNPVVLRGDLSGDPDIRPPARPNACESPRGPEARRLPLRAAGAAPQPRPGPQPLSAVSGGVQHAEAGHPPRARCAGRGGWRIGPAGPDSGFGASMGKSATGGPVRPDSRGRRPRRSARRDPQVRDGSVRRRDDRADGGASSDAAAGDRGGADGADLGAAAADGGRAGGVFGLERDGDRPAGGVCPRADRGAGGGGVGAGGGGVRGGPAHVRGAGGAGGAAGRGAAGSRSGPGGPCRCVHGARPGDAGGAPGGVEGGGSVRAAGPWVPGGAPVVHGGGLGRGAVADAGGS